MPHYKRLKICFLFIFYINQLIFVNIPHDVIRKTSGKGLKSSYFPKFQTLEIPMIGKSLDIF